MLPTRLFARIERFSLRHVTWVFAGVALLAGLATWLGSGLRLDTDILTMVPDDNRVIGVFKRSVRDFGSLDAFLVLVSAPEDGPVDEGGTSAEDYEEFADVLAERLAAIAGVESVEHRLDETSPIFANLSENALLFLGPERLDEVRALFADEAIRQRVSQLRDGLTAGPSFLAKVEARLDPAGMLPLLYDSFLRHRGAFRIDLSDGYYLSADRKSLLLIVKPDRPPQDVAFSHWLRDQVDEARTGAEAELRAGVRPGEPDPLAGMVVDYGGGYIIAIEDSALIKGDILWNAAVSFLLVVGLYVFCYRRLAAIAYSVTPLAVGQALTFGLAWLCLPGLNSATSGFTALLMGLGTDFTIVMYGRYIEERRQGRPLAEAVSRIMGETAIGVFTGVITSAGTFYAMCVTSLPGLRDFGFLVGSGILLCGAAILLLLPAMIAYVEGPRISRLCGVFAFFVFPALPLPGLRWIEQRRLRREGRAQTLYLHSFGVENLLKIARRWPAATAALSLGACVALGVCARDITFSESLRDLRSPHNRGVLVQEEIFRRFGGSTYAMVVMCQGGTLDEAMERNRVLSQRLDVLIAEGAVQGYESFLSYLPPRPAQEAVIRALAPSAPEAFDVDRIERTFRDSLAREGFRPGAYDEWLGALRRTLRPSRVLTAEDLASRGLANLARRYHGVQGAGHVTATYVFPAADRQQGEPLERLAASIQADDPAIEASSVVLVGLELRRLFRRDSVRAVALGLILVAILLYADFRRVSLVALALLQLGGGLAIMLGAVSLLGIPMNFVNAFATTMILGVGVDYGIHMLHRLVRANGAGDEGALETGKAVVMAALTNVAGFGTLAFSNFPGLRGVGVVCVLGTLGCLFTALTLLPALMTLRERRVRPAAQ